MKDTNKATTTRSEDLSEKEKKENAVSDRNIDKDKIDYKYWPCMECVAKTLICTKCRRCGREFDEEGRCINKQVYPSVPNGYALS